MSISLSLGAVRARSRLWGLFPVVAVVLVAGVSSPIEATWVPLGLAGESIEQMSANGEWLFAVTRDASFYERSLWRVRIDGTGVPERVWDSSTSSAWAVACHPVAPDTVYLGINGDLGTPVPDPVLLRSTDGGATFFPFVAGLCESDGGVGLLMASATSPSLLMAASNGGPYLSVSGSGNWVPVPSEFCVCEFPCGGWVSMARGVSDPQVLWVVTASLCQGIEAYRSVDAGQNWGLMFDECDLANRVVRVDPTDADRVYLTRGNLALRSVDGGETWAETPIPSHAGMWLEIDTSDSAVLYAAGGTEIVWSPSYGVTWNQVDQAGLPTEDTLVGFSVDPATQGLLYAAFEEGGIYKTQISVSSVAVGEVQYVPVQPRLVASPNPFEMTTLLRVSDRIDADSPPGVSVFDAAGRLVRRLDLSLASTSGASIRWDGRDQLGGVVSPGIYFATTPLGGSTRLVKLR